MAPKVSVIIPCYNEPKDIFDRSLQSVLDQTLTDIEIILVLDNPDNQELRSIIEWYKSEHENILFLDPGENLWRWLARNLAIDHATGKYIAIHDADDTDYPNRLEDQYNYMEENPDTALVFSEFIRVDSNNQDIGRKKFACTWSGDETSVLEATGKNHPTMFIKSDIIKELKYKDLNYSEDADLWIRLFKNGHKMWYINEVHTRYLTPSFSTHSEYVQKMKQWKRKWTKVMLSHFNYLYKDPLLYKRIFRNIWSYVILSFGKDTYWKYTEVKRNLKKLIKKEA